MERRSDAPRPSPAEHDTLRLGLDFDAVRSRLGDCGIDAAARSALAGFAAIATAGGLAAAVQMDSRVLSHGLNPEDHARNEAADRFGLLFAGFPEWDFTPAWLNSLTTQWLKLIASGARSDWLDALAARVIGHCIALLSDPTRGASMAQLGTIEAVARLLFFLTSVLADASASYAETQHLRALEFDADSGLPNLNRALTRLGTAVAETEDDGFLSVMVVRIQASPALLRMPSTLARQLMSQVIERVGRVLRPRDLLFSGAEWELVVILPGLSSAAHVSLAATRVLHIFDEPFPVFGHEYRLVPAAGAASFPDAGRQPEALLQAARLALHEAQRGSGRYELYRADMERSAARYAAIEHGFLEALRNDQLDLHLQPQVDAATGRCSHAEALLRWPQAGGGNVAPQLIVEIAEEAGVGPQFSRWLVTRAARTLAELTQADIPLHLSINLTANDLHDEELPDVIEQALRLWKVAPDRLTLELTESAMIADEQRSLEILNRLRSLGCCLALDDFGTGYSSMAYLRQLPLNELKIDQVFIRRMEESSQDREIVRSMVQLAHSLRLEVVAEGVETEAAWHLLDSYGCQRLQGYYFSRPMALAQFVRWWHEHHAAAQDREA
jgi:EAL domain-containing protein (putative c-di-GMP-specific phosphodiesterase class I)/GGDEF domain-containing protein